MLCSPAPVGHHHAVQRLADGMGLDMDEVAGRE
jgi:hypothetical protein